MAFTSEGFDLKSLEAYHQLLGKMSKTVPAGCVHLPRVVF